jgi:hypothetical protein
MATGFLIGLYFLVHIDINNVQKYKDILPLSCLILFTTYSKLSLNQLSCEYRINVYIYMDMLI